jgi:hypothetical protein
MGESFAAITSRLDTFKSYGELIGKFIHSIFLGNNRKQSMIFDIETKEGNCHDGGLVRYFQLPGYCNGTPYGMVHVNKRRD